MADRALIAMSGGVDSSVAALLTLEQGLDCIGGTMRLFSNEDVGLPRERTCCSLDDAEDARQVCYRLNIPHYVFNFSDRFRQDVMDRFVQAYECGRTPNPCIDCNRWLKFDKLAQRARDLDCNYIVTGHYARIGRDKNTGRWLLQKAADTQKDQTYFLYSMTQRQLAHTRFPLGGLKKDQVRANAQEHGFVTAVKRESQDICFVPNGRYDDFIRRYTGRDYPPGDFVDSQGRVVGRHRGIICYTVGQRRGLGLAMPEPVYVQRIDPINNTITVCTDKELYSTTLVASQLNFISLPDLKTPQRLQAKVRYRHQEQWATALQTDEDTLQLEFDQPQRAIAPGQAVVLYDGNTVVGGGVIDRTM